MKKIALIFSLYLPLILLAVDQVPILSPGSGGMVSNVDVQEVPANASYFAKNVDIRVPGLIQRRRGIVPFGTNADTVYGAGGFYETYNQQKMIVGGSGNDTTALYTFRSRTWNSGTHSWDWGARDSLLVDANDIGVLLSSDTFALALSVFDTLSSILDVARLP